MAEASNKAQGGSNHAQGSSSLVEQKAGAKSKVLPMFVSSSKLKEELGSIEMRLDKIEDHLMNGHDKFEDVDTRLVELGDGLDDTRAELQAAINITLERLVSENEALKLARAKEVSAKEEDNRVLKEMVERMHEEMKEMQEEIVLLKRFVTQGSETNPHSTLSVPTARVHKKKDCPKRAVPTPPLEPASVESLPCCSLGSMSVVGLSEVPSKDAVDVCGTQVQSKLPKELPPEEEVGCVSEPAAGSPREVVLPKQERPMQRCSRRAGIGARPRGRRSHLATRTGKVLEHSRRPKAMGRMGMREVLGDEGNSEGVSTGEVIHGS
ncbi:hypothetical protein GH714_038911 [Hevea brasiliensis]|uniref:Uncharacterized protein n=1 Tax=Hevea brasiliensis TaxID=3981 RepID=A0A6A6KAN0_HEVBR|nr:hypothetical protein GH714_038911 [Hevea brasiliensis]